MHNLVRLMALLTLPLLLTGCAVRAKLDGEGVFIGVGTKWTDAREWAEDRLNECRGMCPVPEGQD